MLNELKREKHVTAEGIKINYVKVGSGPPLLLLHGYPQCLSMWHKVMPTLSESYTVIASDLRGYGDSSTPPTDDTHSIYSKRAMAQDQLSLMSDLGYEKFRVMAHDRGARVAHRMALDAPIRINKLMLIDIAPTLHMYENTDMAFASAYYHWFMLIQPFNVPEILIGSNRDYFLNMIFRSKPEYKEVFPDEIVAEYLRCFDEKTIHASCEDYRASAGIDLDHDKVDLASRNKIHCPLHIVWGSKGIIGKMYSPIELWQSYADANVSGQEIESGHFIPEENSQAVLSEAITFFK